MNIMNKLCNTCNKPEKKGQLIRHMENQWIHDTCFNKDSKNMVMTEYGPGLLVLK